MAKLAGEVKYPLSVLRKILKKEMEPPPTVPTLRSWIRNGVRNHRGKLVFLVAVLIGRNYWTSLEAFHRFYEETSEEEDE